MRKLAVLGLAALMAVGCSKNNGAQISAQIEGAGNAEVVLYQLAVNQVKTVDTIKTGADGKFSYTVAMPEAAPDFYYLTYKGNKLASFVLKAGDKVSVKVDTLGAGLAIEGSEESLLLGQYEKGLATVSAQMAQMSEQMNAAIEKKDLAAAEELKIKMGKSYVNYRRDLIKTIMENPYSFANINALYQQIGQQLPVFSSENDYLLVERVHDSLATLYPSSVYLQSLKEQISGAKNAIALAEKIYEAETKSFPNLSLPDINAKNVDLSSLEGKPFILMFWTISEPSQKMFNNDLKELYRKYRSSGLEIYQVSLDEDKTAWASAVKDQQLPWISVCDGKGPASPAVVAYNLLTVPTMFVFNAKGDLVANGNLTDKGELENAIRKAIK
ncbi:MAG: TlpA family protein disulfide reductase [Bacteroidales bacterium]|nr:TlpA family protein disulfide reductase [Bacteroidales bacterium]